MFSYTYLYKDRIFSSLKIAAVILITFATVLIGTSQSASAADEYPVNLPPGEYSPAPFSIQTYQFTGLRGEEQVCESSTFIVMSEAYAAEINQSDNDYAYFWVQKPSTNMTSYNGEARSSIAQRTAAVQKTFSGSLFGSQTIDFGEGFYGVAIPAYLVEGDNVDGCQGPDLAASKALHENYAANARVWWTGVNTPPTADFDWELTDADETEVTFTNRSTDGGGGAGNLSYLWEFGDGQTSAEINPVHDYASGGPFNVKLTVTNARNEQASIQKTILENDLVVNSTGDAPAENPELGCNTGNEVGGEAECTLRAALESTEADNGGEITFNIEGLGVPSISVSSALPTITKNTTINAKSQSAGQVEIVGPGTSGDVAGLKATNGKLVAKGLVINNFTTGILIDGGADHEITENRIGVNAQGTEASQSPEIGIWIDKAKAKISKNQIVADGGMYAGKDASNLEISDNKIGVNDTGDASIGEVRSAIAIIGPSAVIKNNTISAKTVGVLLVTVDAKDAVIQDNSIGTTSAGNPLGDLNYGVRVDGAPNASVVNNKIVATIAGVGTAGSPQLDTSDPEDAQLLHPDYPADTGASTGGTTTIRGNVIGTDDEERESDFGIVAWASSNQATIDDNTIVGTVEWGIQVTGGSTHSITSNTIGVQSASTRADTGILVNDVMQSTVGGEGVSKNTIGAITTGIDVQGESTSALTIVGNEVGYAEDGIEIDSEINGGVTITKNIVTNNTNGITIGGDGVVVTENMVNENEVGIVAIGDDIDIEENKIGVDASGDVLGNEDTGIIIEGEARVIKNVIAGHGENGVSSTADAVATLTSNKIYDTGDKPIDAGTGPDTPELNGVIRKTVGTSTRTAMIVTGLPEAGGGTIEIFADNDCSADGGEARYVLDLKRVTKPGETARIVQIIGNATRDFFTATYTDADGHTSELSECKEAQSDHPDSDGDGSVDPLDSIFGMDDDPSSAWVVTDSEELLLVKANSYTFNEDGEPGNFESAALENVAIIDDPAPGAHPSGWQLPYGVLQFRINVPEAGGRALVYLSNFLGSSEMPDAQYWKYGPQTSGAEPSWYNFGFDEESVTGARLITTNTALGIRRSFALAFQDGARGDSDGGANRTITDPGALVLTSSIPGGTNPSFPDDPQVLGTNVGSGSLSSNSSLPTTGSNVAETVVTSLILLLIGIFQLRYSKRTKTV